MLLLRAAELTDTKLKQICNCRLFNNHSSPQISQTIVTNICIYMWVEFGLGMRVKAVDNFVALMEILKKE